MDSLPNLIQPMNTTKLMSQTTYPNGSIPIPPTLLPRNQQWYMYGWEPKTIQLKYHIKSIPYNSFQNILEST
jgi:hypothetical protein